jgi:hypothetical protein
MPFLAACRSADSGGKLGVMLDEGATVAEYVAARDLAVDEGFITMHLSRAYVLFTEKGAERFG